MSELEKKIGSELVVDEAQIYDELVAEAKKLIRLDSGGNPVTVVDKTKLSERDHLYLLLVGRWLAYHVKLQSTDSMTIDEMSVSLPMARKTARARLSELVESGALLRVGKGVYRVEYINAPSNLLSITRKVSR